MGHFVPSAVLSFCRFEFLPFCAFWRFVQGCGAETIFFRSGSGSDFQKVSAPPPAPAPATALELPVITDFMLKRTFFMFLMKEN
jgi:hypothetical protein